MTDYEVGVPSWDIGQILTIHASRAHGDLTDCAMTKSLLSTRGRPSGERLDAALAAGCSCGKSKMAGDAVITTTMLKEERRARAAAATASGGGSR